LVAVGRAGNAVIQRKAMGRIEDRFKGLATPIMSGFCRDPKASVRKHIESAESFVIHGRRPDSLGRRRVLDPVNVALHQRL